MCEAVGHAKRYYGGQTKSHKCQFGGTSDRTRILIYCSQHIEHFLELMPVVEKPEIVEAKERKLKSLGKKYLVNVFSDVLLLKKTPFKKEKGYGLTDFVFQRTFYGFSKLKMKKLFQRKLFILKAKGYY